MGTTIVYASHEQMQEILPALRATGAVVGERNPKYYGGEVEPCDAVVIAPGSPNAETIVANYQAKGIPVRVYGESETLPFDPLRVVPPNGEGDADNQTAETGQSNEPADTSTETESEFNTMVERGAKALFNKGRARGLTMDILRDGIRERGVEAVAKEVGIESKEELDKLLEKVSE